MLYLLENCVTFKRTKNFLHKISPEKYFLLNNKKNLGMCVEKKMYTYFQYSEVFLP